MNNLSMVDWKEEQGAFLGSGSQSGLHFCVCVCVYTRLRWFAANTEWIIYFCVLKEGKKKKKEG